MTTTWPWLSTDNLDGLVAQVGSDEAAAAALTTLVTNIRTLADATHSTALSAAIRTQRRTKNALGQLAHSLDLSGVDRAIDGERAQVGRRKYRLTGTGTAEIVGNQLIIEPTVGAATILSITAIKGMKWTRLAWTSTPGSTTDDHNAVVGWSRNGFGSPGDLTLGGPASGGGSVQVAGYNDRLKLFVVEVEEVGAPGWPGLVDPYTDLLNHVYAIPPVEDGVTAREVLIGYDRDTSSMTVIDLYDMFVTTVTNPLINAYYGDEQSAQARRTHTTDGHIQITGWDHWVDDTTAAAHPVAPPVAGACPVLAGDGFVDVDFDWTPTGVLQITTFVDAVNIGTPADETFASVWSLNAGAHAFDFRANGYRLQLTVSSDGTNTLFGVGASQDVPVHSGKTGLRFVMDPVAATVKFYTSVDDGGSWPQLGTTRPSTAGLPFASPEPLRLGMRSKSNGLHGTILSVEMIDNGVTIVDLDWTGSAPVATVDEGPFYINAGFEQADIAARLSAAEAAIIAAVSGAQPADADLTVIAGLTPTDNDLLQRKAGAWINRSISQVKSDMNVVADVINDGTVAVAPSQNAVFDALATRDTAIAAAVAGAQPLDSDLTAIAALAPANDDVVQRKAGAWVNRTIPQLKSDLGLVADALNDGTVAVAPSQNAVFDALATRDTAIAAKQDGDSDLTAIAALSPANDDVIQRKAGAWTNRTIPQLKSDLGLVADAINDGTVAVAPSQNAVFDALATKPTLDANGHLASTVMGPFVQNFNTFRRTGAIVESISRVQGVANGASWVSSRMLQFGIFLPKGTVVTHLTFLSGQTAGATLTHAWAALFDSSRALLKVTNDDTSAAWAQNTEKTLDIQSGAYTVAADGIFYVGLVVTGTTMPTLSGQTLSTGVGLLAPIMAGTTSATYTTGPGSVPNPAPAPDTSYAAYAYFYIS